MSDDRTPGFNTLAIHAGAQPDPTTGARATPIYQTTSFVFDDVDHAASLFGLQAFGNIYTRIGNPTNAVLEERVAALEGGTAALAVASGHAAQVIVMHDADDAGRRIRRLARSSMAARSTSSTTPSRISAGTWCGPTRTTSRRFERAITPKTKAIFIESIANPGGVITDIEAVVEDRPQGRRAADRRQHAGDALPLQADRLRRRHRRALAHQVPRRPRQFDRRHDRRWRHLQLVARRPLSDAVRAAPGISRHRAARDLRQLRLRDRLPRARPARPRPGAVAVQRVPDPHRHRDAAAAHAAPLRQRAGGRELAREAAGSRVGELSRPAERQVSRARQEIRARRAPARCSPSASRAATTPA